jgi:hypothetical protein
MAIITHHTYPDLLYRGGKLADCEWDGGQDPQQGVDATLAVSPEAVILRVTDWREAQPHQIRGLAPGGIG